MSAKLFHINSVGGDLYVVRPFHRAVDPDYGVSSEHPDQGLPGSPGYPDQGLPGSPGRPDNSLPAIPGVPDNTLPTTPPPVVAPGVTLVIVRGPDGKWRWATTATAPTPLPEPPPTATPKA